MKMHTLLDAVLLLLTLSFTLKMFIVMLRFGNLNLPAVMMPGEFQYLAALLF